MMTPRKRITAAVEFKGPDRIPFQHAVFPGAFWRHGQALVDLLEQFPDDFGHRRFAIPDAPPDEIEEYTDEWGSLWQRRKGYTTGEVRRPALESWDRWPDYNFPPGPSPKSLERLAARAQDPNREEYISGGGGNLFERLQFIRGSENLFMDLGEDCQEVHELADRVVDWNLQFIRGHLQAGVDGIGFGDDWGAQDRLLIHPDRWRAFFKPRYRRMFEPVLEAGKHIWFHTDGWTADIWDDFIELGVTVLNPQHHVMPRGLLAEKLSGRIAIRSDLDRQGIIPHGTPEQIREHVRDTIVLFGRFNGGLVLHGEIGPDVPLENARAMYEAFVELGEYPLRWL